MKTIFTILLFVFSCLIYSQNSFRIADTTKTWNTVHGGFWSFMVAHCSGTTSNMFQGDTVIGGKTYLKVYKSQDSLQINWDHVGELREDTINHLVYFHKFWHGEGLIYDFNLEIGDSIYIDNYYINVTDVILICNGIDSVNINGSIRKRFFLYSEYSSDYCNDVWIEGIGSIYGLFNSGIGAGYLGGFSKLLCCSSNDTIIYMDTTFNTCYIDEFYPKITSEYYDTAYLSTNYEFQLQPSDTTNIDSIYWRGECIPEGFFLNESTGVLSGVPASIGSFPCLITVVNYDIGYITDILDSYIEVFYPDQIQEISKQFDIKVYPNPCRTSLYINIGTKVKEDYYLEIYNYSGIVIEEKIIRNGLSEIDCSGYKKGIYLLKFTDSENKIVKIEKVTR